MIREQSWSKGRRWGWFHKIPKNGSFGFLLVIFTVFRVASWLSILVLLNILLVAIISFLFLAILTGWCKGKFWFIVRGLLGIFRCFWNSKNSWDKYECTFWQQSLQELLYWRLFPQYLSFCIKECAHRSPNREDVISFHSFMALFLWKK